MICGLGSVSVITGIVVSTTVISNEAEPVFSAESVAVQVTVVVSIANVLPETGVHVAGSTPSTISNADALNVTAAPDPLVASSVMFSGTVSIGAVVSTTVTVLVT